MWPVFVAYAIVFVTPLAVGMLIAVIAMARHGPAPSPDFAAAIDAVAFSLAGLTVSVTINEMMLAGVAAGGAMLSPVPWRERLALGASGASWRLVAVMVVGTLALSTALDALAGLLGVQDYGVLPRLRQITAQASWPGLALLTVVLGLMPGLAEELFFRGYMQTRLTQRWGPRAAILCTGLLFGLLHLDPVQSPLAAGLGFYFGYVTWLVGSLWPAVVCHVANNVVATLGAAAFPADMFGGRRSALLWLAACVILLGLCLVQIRGTLGRKERG